MAVRPPSARPEIVAHDLVTRAVRQARTDDFGGNEWSEPLEILTRALDREARLTTTGRRRVRAYLVDLIASRAALPAEAPAIIIAALPGCGGEQLVDAIGGCQAPAFDAFERELTSMSFELRWHVPSYSEWLAESALGDTYERLDGLSVGVLHLEQLATARRSRPGAVVVQVLGDEDAGIERFVAASVEARRRDSDDVDDAKVARYWRWRLALVLERNRAQRAAADLGIIDVSADEARADAANVAARILGR